MLTRSLIQGAVIVYIVDGNLRLYIVLIGAASGTGIFEKCPTTYSGMLDVSCDLREI